VKNLMMAVMLVAGICLSSGGAAMAGTSSGAATETKAAAQTQATGSGQASAADQKATAQDIELMRKDIRSMRKQLVAANLKLTDAEATKFWPVYDQYIAELVQINHTKYELLQEYFNSYGQLTDEQADRMCRWRSCGRNISRCSARRFQRKWRLLSFSWTGGLR
jgi:Spy/CpxP family protein refolding chaperone